MHYCDYSQYDQNCTPEYNCYDCESCKSECYNTPCTPECDYSCESECTPECCEEDCNISCTSEDKYSCDDYNYGQCNCVSKGTCKQKYGHRFESECTPRILWDRFESECTPEYCENRCYSISNSEDKQSCDYSRDYSKCTPQCTPECYEEDCQLNCVSENRRGCNTKNSNKHGRHNSCKSKCGNSKDICFSECGGNSCSECFMGGMQEGYDSGYKDGYDAGYEKAKQEVKQYVDKVKKCRRKKCCCNF